MDRGLAALGKEIGSTLRIRKMAARSCLVGPESGTSWFMVMAMETPDLRSHTARDPPMPRCPMPVHTDASAGAEAG